jgi:hypothetical protein
LLTVFIVVCLIQFLLTGPTLDIGFNYIYLALLLTTLTQITQPFLFLMLVTIIYLIKEGVHGYKRKLQNIILITSNFLFIIQLTKRLEIVGFLMLSGETTIYPPLSALPKVKPSLKAAGEVFHMERILFAILIFFMLILVITAILTGKNWKPASHETKT